MIKYFCFIIFLFLLFCPTNVKAEKWLGIQGDAGYPDGLALGPYLMPVKSLRFHLSGTYNYAYGIRSGLTIDPFNELLSPSLSVEGGYVFPGSPIFIPGDAKISYVYFSMHLGFEFGKPGKWRLFTHGGITWVRLKTHQLEDIFNRNDIHTEEAQADGYIFPTGKIGFAF